MCYISSQGDHELAVLLKTDNLMVNNRIYGQKCSYQINVGISNGILTLIQLVHAISSFITA